MRRTLIIAATLCFPAAAHAQTVMGTVSTHDAQVTGGLQVQGERASLISNAAITAYDHAAPVALTRGGSLLVCATSQFHLLHFGAGNALLFGLDRGALELHGASDPQDVILTPDIRFTLEAPGTYDLSLRVTANGDTCVQNAGSGSPVLVLADPFSSSSYRLVPGQHVLFEHGSLKEVVDNERSPCGCPSEGPLVAATPAERDHPFPAAASAGLAPLTPPSNSSPNGETQAQVTTTLSYSPGKPQPTDNAPASTPTPVATTSVSTEPPATPPGPHDILHSIGHFFHKIFHRSDASTPKPSR
jgi:hypothetical protein